MNAPVPEQVAQAKLWSHTIYRDSYNQDSEWYSLTFKPFNRAFDKDPQWFTNKSLDAVRKRLPRGIKIITLETEATKPHINVLISTDIDMVAKFHDKNILHKYKVWCEPTQDKKWWFDYIFKESKNRPFESLKDYYIYNPIKCLSEKSTTKTQTKSKEPLTDQQLKVKEP